MTRHDDSLRIVSDELWNEVRAIQTTSHPRRAALRVGHAKRAFRFRSKYLLWGTLVCAECGSNFVGDGPVDYICPSHTVGRCKNDLRFRRDVCHQAFVELLTTYLADDEVVARGRQRIEVELLAEAREEKAASRRMADGSALRKLDAQAAALRAMDLPASAITAALTELERQREALRVQAKGRPSATERRPERLLARLDEITAAYQKLVGRAVKVLAKPEVVGEASEAIRRLLVDGRITLSPTPDHTRIAGPVHFKDLGSYLLEMAGGHRQLKDCGGGLIYGTTGTSRLAEPTTCSVRQQQPLYR